MFAVSVAAVGALTRGFEHWTFEDLRQALATLGQLRAPPTAVRTSRGDVRTLFEGEGRRDVYLVDFIYTTCASVCQSLGSEYQRMQTALDDQPVRRVQLVSLSFDVARDSEAELGAYARRYGARPDRWTVAAPLTEQRTRELTQRLGVVVVADGTGGYVHNGDIHLIDGSGVLRGVYAYEEWPDALDAARGLAVTP
jgi:protein SCO1/2